MWLLRAPVLLGDRTCPTIYSGLTTLSPPQPKDRIAKRSLIPAFGAVLRAPRHQASRKHPRRARAPLVCPSRKGRSARRRADESPQKHRMARPPRPRPIISAITRSEAGRCSTWPKVYQTRGSASNQMERPMKTNLLLIVVWLAAIVSCIALCSSLPNVLSLKRRG